MCLSYSLGLMTNWTQCSQGSGVSISVAVGKTAITGDTQSPHPGDTKSPHSGLRTAQRVQLNPQHSSELLGREDRQTDRHWALLHCSTRLEYLPLNHSAKLLQTWALGSGPWLTAEAPGTKGWEIHSLHLDTGSGQIPQTPLTHLASAGMGTQVCPWAGSGHTHHTGSLKGSSVFFLPRDTQKSQEAPTKDAHDPCAFPGNRNVLGSQTPVPMSPLLGIQMWINEHRHRVPRSGVQGADFRLTCLTII